MLLVWLATVVFIPSTVAFKEVYLLLIVVISPLIIVFSLIKASIFPCATVIAVVLLSILVSISSIAGVQPVGLLPSSSLRFL